MGPISEKSHNLKIFGPNSSRNDVRSLQKCLFFYFWIWHCKIHISFLFVLALKNLLFSSSALHIAPKKIWLIDYDDIWSILPIFGHYWPFSQERFPRGLAHCGLLLSRNKLHQNVRISHQWFIFTNKPKDNFGILSLLPTHLLCP